MNLSIFIIIFKSKTIVLSHFRCIIDNFPVADEGEVTSIRRLDCAQLTQDNEKAKIR